MMYMALDPGVATGIATYDYEPMYPSKKGGIHHTYEIRFSDYPHPHEMLYDHLSERKPDFIIYEAFHYRHGQLGAEFVGVEYIGVIELWCQRNQVSKYKINPSDGKGFWSMNKIKTLGLWTPRKQEMDALRLLLTYLLKFDPSKRSEYLDKLKAAS